MQARVTFFALFLILMRVAIPNAQAADTSKTVYEGAASMVFPIRTATDPQSSKASYGSGFVIQKEGLLATNFHVVSSAANDPDKYHLYVIMNGTAIEAKIAAIDIAHDLALIRVAREFPSELRVDPREPSTGEKLYSIGQPRDLNMSVVEGVYNGIQIAGPFEELVLSSPINAGMSGGPTLDSQGMVAGVNVATLLGAQNISFAVPARHLIHLMSELIPRDRRLLASETPFQFAPIAKSQLSQISERWTREWLAAGSKTIQSWQALGPPKGLKCWHDSKNFAKSTGIGVTTEYCGSIHTASPSRGIQVGGIDIYYAHLSSSHLKTAAFFNKMNQIFTVLPEKISQNFFSLESEQAANFTDTECAESIVVNDWGVPLKVNFCAAGARRFDPLVDSIVKVITLEKTGDNFMMTMRLRGFTAGNVKTLIEAIIQSIRNTEPKSERGKENVIPS